MACSSNQKTGFLCRPGHVAFGIGRAQERRQLGPAQQLTQDGQQGVAIGIGQVQVDHEHVGSPVLDQFLCFCTRVCNLELHVAGHAAGFAEEQRVDTVVVNVEHAQAPGAATQAMFRLR